ncbi:uncharacterized protein LOC135075840 isoform X2 [Ostrinia nubilalis]|uniref:uncharacterized protein LOC135075840 isoform X2 n=1 Tax=Ostrinia nubilalis TaxID=29057 RepID=UPI0030823552
MRDRFRSGIRVDIKQLTNDFPKKLLVAVTVVIIVAMCLRPAEAASIEHKRHRGPHDNMKPTKDSSVSRTEALLKDHKRRHQGQKNGTHTTKDTLGSLRRQTDPYERARIKIENKVSYTKDNFDERRKELKESGDYGSGMPTWLPKTNFVDIHFHNYRISHKNEAAKSKRIFVFLIRKLYKSLLEYHELFKRFKVVEVVSPDTQITSYNVKRQVIFTKTTDDLYSAIEDIKDAMISVKMPAPKINLAKMKLDTIKPKVDAARYLKNDDILLRAYGNLLDNWHLEFNCSKFRKTGKNRKVALHKCVQYENNLREKRNKRKRNKRKKQPSSP